LSAFHSAAYGAGSFLKVAEKMFVKKASADKIIMGLYENSYNPIIIL
jgi:hypothetical protein